MHLKDISEAPLSIHCSSLSASAERSALIANRCNLHAEDYIMKMTAATAVCSASPPRQQQRCCQESLSLSSAVILYTTTALSLLTANLHHTPVTRHIKQLQLIMKDIIKNESI